MAPRLVEKDVRLIQVYHGGWDGHAGLAWSSKIPFMCMIFMHLLGMDHERLTYKYQSRHFGLTDVYGQVVKKVLV